MPVDTLMSRYEMIECKHINNVKPVKPMSKGCVDCLKTGDEWVHLRVCMECGYVGCCDSSKNTHATKHYQKTGHPIVFSFQPGENWGWCYEDEVMFEFEDDSETNITP